MKIPMIPLRNYARDNLKNDLLSGLVVAVALVPEAIAFSFIVGINPIIGLYTAFILGLVTAILGGKPGMISGATGSVAVVLVGLAVAASAILKHAGLSGDALELGVLQYIFLTAILAGLIQILFGVLRFGKFIRLVPLPAIYGFVNGLAIVIALSQLKFFHGQDWVMVSIVIATMLIMYYLPRYTKAVPAGLVAIVVMTLVVYFGHIHTLLIGDLANLSEFKGQLPSFHIPPTLFSWEAIKMVAPYALIVALVGLIESLLTLAVLDEMSGTRGSGNRECVAQGVGNVTCGFFGAMPGCAMIGQSIINFTSGGLGRLSSATAAIGLMVLVASLTDLLNIIPVGVLVGIMFMVSIGTFEWSSFGHLKKMPPEDAFVMVVVTVITIFFDLAVAVIIGVIISALVFAWKHARIYARTKELGKNAKLYELSGPLFFGSVQSFNDTFDVENDPKVVVIDFKNARVMDSSGVEAIEKLTERYAKAGKKLTLRHLSDDCKAVLKRARANITQEEDDPGYKVARDY
ncbi:SulP family inorganic anion transporter [Nitratifractor salsuginis]|uniref:Sulphate transporter n=1 Tax=Nitratifractor salsuginis (strain DSM 16511 / JCM 12458 / E9I37-1) TaxID=749222 RepID=E6WYT6_NITSE|nr:SulP family inorganic anion transporter [Nitratifractor salsuginis]ADV46522.1 sulphate transporter [Nitratifractor salsuginis DSM 16511]